MQESPISFIYLFVIYLCINLLIYLFTCLFTYFFYLCTVIYVLINLFICLFIFLQHSLVNEAGSDVI